MRPSFPTRVAPTLLSILRIVTALLLMQHGLQKLLGWFGGMGPDGGTAMPITLPWIAGVIELVGGALVALGLLTRPVAFLIAGEMAVAYFMAHAPRSFFPIENGGEPTVLFCFVFLYLAAAGPGPWSLDALRDRGRARY